MIGLRRNAGNEGAVAVPANEHLFGREPGQRLLHGPEAQAYRSGDLGLGGQLVASHPVALRDGIEQGRTQSQVARLVRVIDVLHCGTQALQRTGLQGPRLRLRNPVLRSSRLLHALIGG
jgi:glycerol-3-phosphate O-acyltransferase